LDTNTSVMVFLRPECFLVAFSVMRTRDSQLSSITKFYNHFGSCKGSISATILENAATKGLITSSVASNVTAVYQLLQQLSFQYIANTSVVFTGFSYSFSVDFTIRRVQKNVLHFFGLAIFFNFLLFFVPKFLEPLCIQLIQITIQYPFLHEKIQNIRQLE